jgi:hypothetical protein
MGELAGPQTRSVGGEEKNVLFPCRNPTLLPWLSSRQPIYYTDWATQLTYFVVRHSKFSTKLHMFHRCNNISQTTLQYRTPSSSVCTDRSWDTTNHLRRSDCVALYCHISIRPHNMVLQSAHRKLYNSICRYKLNEQLIYNVRTEISKECNIMHNHQNAEVFAD